MNLNKFVQTQNLFACCIDFFENDLNIKINPFDSKPIAVKDFFKDLKKIATLAVQNIDTFYVVGSVDNNSLNNKQSEFKNVDDAIKITKDYDGLLLCAAHLKTTPSRAQLAEITRLVNRAFPYMPITIIFRYDDKITFANAERVKYLQPWREGEKFGKISMLKDIDLEKPHGAHLKILHSLKAPATTATFDELYQYWQKVLNTKALNKEFFKKIANWYFLSVAHSKFPYEYLKNDSKNSDKSKEQLQELANQKASIRFITRMIFVWFLKEKGLVDANLFNKKHIDGILKKSKNENNYYNAILQNLFFATLNRSPEFRQFADDKGYNKNKTTDYDQNSFYRYEKMFQNENLENIMQLFANIPFLNGGLFDSLDIKPNAEDPKIEIIDGFSRNDKWKATMPDFLFFESENLDFDTELNQIYVTSKKKYEVKGLFEIFGEYKFTIEENTPLETDVALDPYLLGEIFENLLAYYNPETGSTARKGSGSFYTPQEIVNYMVDESLKAYNPTNLDAENVENLTDIEKYDYVKKLSEVKILDPACGSGAFPMGVLYKMVDLLKTVDPDNSIWKRVQHDKIIGDKIAELETDKKAILGLSDLQVKAKATKAVEDRLLELETIFNNEYNFDDYARKLYIIQNCIYGVDIQDVAIQISKLRFFLSLIVDQKNDDIKPLPNLETKFVIANTLIGIDLPKFQVMGQDDHSQDNTKALKEQLKKVRENHFKATTRKEKLSLKAQDKTIRAQIANSLADSMNSYKQSDVDKWHAEIVAQKKYLAEAEQMPDMVQEIVVRDLFGGESLSKINYRKERIKECNNQIKNIETKLANLQTNTQAEQIRTQALKIADWDIYNQNASADWFDMDWMFGITDGFDIVIGNPPYGALSSLSDKGYFKIFYQTTKTIKNIQKGSLDTYSLFIENGYNLLKRNGNLIYIVPISITSSESMTATHNLLESTCSKIKISSYSVRPQPVFENAVVNTSILFFKKDYKINETILSTKMYRKNKAIDLRNLVENLEFIDVKKTKIYGRYPKISLEIENNILLKLHSIIVKLKDIYISAGNPIYYRTTGGRYFKVITNYSTGSTKEKAIFISKAFSNVIGAILSSNLYFWWYQIYSNNLDLKSFEIDSFPFPKEKFDERIIKELEILYEAYLIDIEKNANVRETKKYANIDSFKEYKIGKSKFLIDKIDDLIGSLYGLTVHEIEFIKNYEIEFRISDDF